MAFTPRSDDWRCREGFLLFTPDGHLLRTVGRPLSNVWPVDAGCNDVQSDDDEQDEPRVQQGQYSNQSMGVWYNPITDKPASLLSTAEESAAEPAGEQRAEQGGPCARIGSRREPRAWA